MFFTFFHIFPIFKILVFLLLVVMSAQSLSSKALLTIGGIYLSGVNVGAAALFWYDKQQALRHGWRVDTISFIWI